MKPRTGSTTWGVLLLVGTAVVGPAVVVHADCIADLVAQVSETRIRDHVEALEFPRNTAASQAVASAYIVGELTSYGYSVTLDPVLTSENVIARLEGTQTPNSVFVLGAHFDSVSGAPGADDDASGVAGMLEVARILAGVQTESSVEFVGFALEELGLIGSSQYALQAFNAGVDIIGMISLEMIGYTCATPGCQFAFPDIPGCFDVEPEGVDVGTFIAALGNDASAQLLNGFVGAATTYVPGLEFATALVAGTGGCFSDTRRSDHAPFWDAGYHALLFSDTANFRNPYYHTPNDTSDTLDFAFARHVTQAALATVALQVQVTCLPPSYTLTIDVNKGQLGHVALDPEPNDPNLPQYPAGTDVTLTAEPNEGKVFRKWRVFDPNFPNDANYAVIDTNNPITIVMSADRKVKAIFKCGGGTEALLPLLALGGLTLLRRRRTRSAWQRES